MPIPEKIDAARQKYSEKLKEVQTLASGQPPVPDFERKAISLLLEMVELKTEAEILSRVVRHQTSSEN